MGTPLNDAEWNLLNMAFPNIFRPYTLKTGPATANYNCMRFALATPGLWVNPPPQLPDFIALFQSAGWATCPFDEGKVDGYALANGRMKHASRYTTAWESKLGSYIRIQHVRTQLSNHPAPGSIYGDIVVSFKRSAAPVTASSVVAAQVSAPESVSTEVESFSSNTVKIDAVIFAFDIAFPALAGEFETAYAAWKDTWFNEQMQLKESSEDRATGMEWDKLVTLTASILPKVVDKLKSDSDLFAVEIYNKLQTDTKKKVSPSDIKNYYYLDAQAQKIVQLYGSAVADFNAHATEWKDHCKRTRLSSDSNDYANHPAFDAIVAMGKDHAMPLVMIEYSQDVGGWWHELMYELVYGRKSGANTFDKRALYKEWKEFFETRNGEAVAPAA